MAAPKRLTESQIRAAARPRAAATALGVRRFQRRRTIGPGDLSVAEAVGVNMSKAKDTRKDAKKKPAKSLMEKRAAKKEKRASKTFQS